MLLVDVRCQSTSSFKLDPLKGKYILSDGIYYQATLMGTKKNPHPQKTGLELDVPWRKRDPEELCLHCRARKWVAGGGENLYVTGDGRRMWRREQRENVGIKRLGSLVLWK